VLISRNKIKIKHNSTLPRGRRQVGPQDFKAVWAVANVMKRARVAEHATSYETLSCKWEMVNEKKE